MIHSYTLQDGRLVTELIARKEQLTTDCLWLDLEKPRKEELAWIDEVFGQQLPSMDKLVEIEASSRFFQDESGLHVRSYFLHEIPEHVYNVTVAFVLNKGRLFTLRDEALMSFQQYRRSLEMQKGLAVDAFGIMLGLFETKVDRLADLLEQLHVDLEALSARVFHAEEQDFDEVLTLLAASQDKNDKTRLSLMDKQRVLSFLLRSRGSPEELLPLLHEILRDIRSLGRGVFDLRMRNGTSKSSLSPSIFDSLLVPGPSGSRTGTPLPDGPRGTRTPSNDWTPRDSCCYTRLRRLLQSASPTRDYRPPRSLSMAGSGGLQSGQYYPGVYPGYLVGVVGPLC